MSKSKNLELVPLKTSNENNKLSPETRPNPTQGSTMWKKKPATETRPVTNSTTIPANTVPMSGMKKTWKKFQVTFCQQQKS
jgi:hypothetical protein